MTKLDETVEARAVDPLRCDHAHQERHGSGSGVYYLCLGCGAFINYEAKKKSLPKAS